MGCRYNKQKQGQRQVDSHSPTLRFNKPAGAGHRRGTSISFIYLFPHSLRESEQGQGTRGHGKAREIQKCRLLLGLFRDIDTSPPTVTLFPRTPSHQGAQKESRKVKKDRAVMGTQGSEGTGSQKPRKSEIVSPQK